MESHAYTNNRIFYVNDSVVKVYVGRTIIKILCGLLFFQINTHRMDFRSLSAACEGRKLFSRRQFSLYINFFCVFDDDDEKKKKNEKERERVRAKKKLCKFLFTIFYTKLQRAWID